MERTNESCHENNENNIYRTCSPASFRSESITEDRDVDGHDKNMNILIARHSRNKILSETPLDGVSKCMQVSPHKIPNFHGNNLTIIPANIHDFSMPIQIRQCNYPIELTPRFPTVQAFSQMSPINPFSPMQGGLPMTMQMPGLRSTFLPIGKPQPPPRISTKFSSTSSNINVENTNVSKTPQSEILTGSKMFSLRRAEQSSPQGLATIRLIKPKPIVPLALHYSHGNLNKISNPTTPQEFPHNSEQSKVLSHYVKPGDLSKVKSLQQDTIWL